jgi:hypothetical protein
MPRAASVLTGPALTAFTRMFFGPSSYAIWRVACSSTALALPMTL